MGRRGVKQISLFHGERAAEHDADINTITDPSSFTTRDGTVDVVDREKSRRKCFSKFDLPSKSVRHILVTFRCGALIIRRRSPLAAPNLYPVLFHFVTRAW